LSQTVISSLLPVVLLIAVGLLAGWRRWIRDEAAKDLSNLVFLILSPALMFRAMSTVHVEDLHLGPVLAYFIAAWLVFGGTLWLRGFNTAGAVRGMANIYSNLVMIGLPLVDLAYGPPGMITLLTLVSLHALVLLTTATVALELAAARDAEIAARAARAAQEASGIEVITPKGIEWRRLSLVLFRAVRSAVIHPVPIPIIAGLLFAQTGLTVPDAVDRPLQWLGQAFGPLALVMVGITLAHTRIGQNLRGALVLASVKNLLLPALVWVIGTAMGLSGLPLTIMVVAGAMPMGANVFLFSQRYKVEEGLITAAVAVSTLMAMLTVSLVMIVLGK
jgi:malonate transporter